MPLNPIALADALQQQWLDPPGGFPANVQESGDRFAAAVAPWFATGMAAGFPCTTAVAWQPQLASAAAAALAAGLPPLAGAQLAAGLAAYMAGQIFGPGVANPPAAATPAQIAFAAVFSDFNADAAARATRCPCCLDNGDQHDRGLPAGHFTADASAVSFLYQPLQVRAEGRVAVTSDADRHLRDKVMAILFTAPGERVNSPRFGVGLNRMVFEPLDELSLAALEFRVSEGLRRDLGEDAVLDDVTLNAIPESGELVLSITVRRRADRQMRRIEVLL